jgi:FMN-dependent NADH-azoreductase
MARLLHVDSSLFAAEASVSKDIARSFRETWEREHPGGEVVHRDLGAAPVPLLSADAVVGGMTPEGQRTAEQETALAVRRELVDEVLAADAYLFAVPMYNWGIPGNFKAWLDQIIEQGRTMLPDGSPLSGRPATVVLSYGGGYFAGAPREGWDHVRPYLETVLVKALGLDARFVIAQLTLAERVPAMADLIPQAKEQRAQAHASAEAHAKEIAGLFASAAAA